MAGITLQQAQDQLNMWLDASSKISEAQSYSINGRSLTRANLKEVTDQIKFWDMQVKRLERNNGQGGLIVRSGVPRD